MLIRFVSIALTVTGALALTGGAALAQDPCGGEQEWVEGDACGGGDPCAAGDVCGGEGATHEGYGATAGDDAHNPMVQAAGAIGVDVFVEANLSSGAVFKPLSIAPDVWYGVNDDLTVGVLHSQDAATGFWGGTAEGLCLSGESNGCAKVYNNVGFEGRYAVKHDDALSIAADAALLIPAISKNTGMGDVMFAGLKVGALGEWRSGKITVESAPSLYVAVTERDFNKDEIVIPVAVMYQVDPKLRVGAQTGVQGTVDHFGDNHWIPLAVRGRYRVNDVIDVGGTFTFPNIAGSGASGDERELSVYVGYAL